jgi:hypothetical protein
MLEIFYLNGAPGEIRTPDLLIRSRFILSTYQVAGSSKSFDYSNLEEPRENELTKYSHKVSRRFTTIHVASGVEVAESAITESKKHTGNQLSSPGPVGRLKFSFSLPHDAERGESHAIDSCCIGSVCEHGARCSVRQFDPTDNQHRTWRRTSADVPVEVSIAAAAEALTAAGMV